MFHPLKQRLFISLCKTLKYSNLDRQNQQGLLLIDTLHIVKLTKAKKNDFSPHKFKDLKNSNNINSINKTNVPLISNIHIWLYL